MNVSAYIIKCFLSAVPFQKQPSLLVGSCINFVMNSKSWKRKTDPAVHLLKRLVSFCCDQSILTPFRLSANECCDARVAAFLGASGWLLPLQVTVAMSCKSENNVDGQGWSKGREIQQCTALLILLLENAWPFQPIAWHLACQHLNVAWDFEFIWTPLPLCFWPPGDVRTVLFSLEHLLFLCSVIPNNLRAF